MVKVIAFLAAVCAALALTSATAQAESDPTIQTMIDQITEANPGARQISADTVRLANGVEATASTQASCPYEHLCIYDQQDLIGNRWAFYRCGFVNIGNEGWSDRIRSFVNNQTTGTVSIFMNWTGSQWEELYRSRALDVHYRTSLVQLTDGIWVC